MSRPRDPVGFLRYLEWSEIRCARLQISFDAVFFLAYDEMSITPISSWAGFLPIALPKQALRASSWLTAGRPFKHVNLTSYVDPSDLRNRRDSPQLSVQPDVSCVSLVAPKYHFDLVLVRFEYCEIASTHSSLSVAEGNVGASLSGG
ncbi:hypothetical protein B2J93_3553 [Marssonina coronariae]|uniref:Uncharacterized protein n=1 Tax=Diplocarpon coronariae TaxID=2795749 RepID=A0A218Z626_9HELO|nr:hypothetical protein B2J93_3553 [Marssonina coronariae]